MEPVPIMEPPKRVFDSSTQFFPDYGYKSPGGLRRALRESLDTQEIPHLVFVLGKPKSGKMHVVWDLANKLSNRLSKPPDIVLWGYSFSIAKYKGRIHPGVYGEYDYADLNAVTDELCDLTYKTIRDHQGRKHLIFIKVPPSTGAEINGQFYGRNRGYTALKAVAKRMAPFTELAYKSFWIGEVADFTAEAQGNRVRPELEQSIDKPIEVAQKLQESGEIILTRHGRITEEEQKVLIDYVAESANPQASREIKFLTNNLAVEMANHGRFRLDPTGYAWDGETKGYFFYDPQQETQATALVLREILENLFLISKGVFLGKNSPLNQIAADLRAEVRNVAKTYYPEIQDIKNK